MVYYNPYKQFLRALIRSVRVFISSLFSKRLLLMIIVALVIMLLHLNVNAETLDDNYTYVIRNNATYNENTNTYDFYRHIYTQNGLYDGTISVPADIYNSPNWFLFLDRYNNPIIYQFTGGETSYSYNFYLIENYGNVSLSQITSGLKAYKDQWNIYTYNSSTNNWDVTHPNSNNNYTFYSRDTMSPNIKDINPYSIIRWQGCTVYYRCNGQDISISQMRRNANLLKPEITYMPDTGFRIKLNDFYGRTISNDQFDEYFTLDDCVFIVYDYKTEQFVTQDGSLLTYTDVQGNEEEGYYIDVLFNDYLTYMNKNDGDYLICFKPYLKQTTHFNSFNKNVFDYSCVYNDLIYSRYVYYKNSGVGILRQANEDGSLKEGQEEFPDAEKLEQQLTEKARLDAINGVTNSINDMSDFMQDDSFSSDSITDNMPSSDEFQDITESGFDNIFTTLRNAFTSDNYKDVVIGVPFSNGQTITIPSNLTENIIPTQIKSLIQMVYWYFIARFIVKDIASYIEKAKSGDIFSSSDTNIKTDML